MIWSSKSALVCEGRPDWLLGFYCQNTYRVMFSLDHFCVKASYINNKAHYGPWSPRQDIYIDIVCSPACCSPNVSEQNVKKKKKIIFPFTPLFPTSPGLVGTGNYAWLWTEMLDRSFLMISLTARKVGKNRGQNIIMVIHNNGLLLSPPIQKMTIISHMDIKD